MRDFPCSLVVKNLPFNAADMGSIPRRETKIPRALEKLTPCAAKFEAVGHN